MIQLTIFFGQSAPSGQDRRFILRKFFPKPYVGSGERGKIDSPSDDKVIQSFCLWACEPGFLFTVFWFLIKFNDDQLLYIFAIGSLQCLFLKHLRFFQMSLNFSFFTKISSVTKKEENHCQKFRNTTNVTNSLFLRKMLTWNPVLWVLASTVRLKEQYN